MKKTCLSKLRKIFVFIFFFLIFVTKINAQDFMSLTASPVRLGDDFTISLKPGEKKQVRVKIRNGSVEAVKLETAALDFIVGEDGASPILINLKEKNNRWSLSSWLTLAPAMHDLASEEVAVVNVLIEVPADALPGGHYAMIYHRPVDLKTEEIMGSGVSQRVGTLLYVLIEGDINEEAYIGNFDWPRFMENGPIDFSLSIDNQSDVHIRTQPTVKVYNLFGKELANLELETKNIFPMTTREFLGNWDRVWGFGPYKAVAEVAYGSQGQVLFAESVIWLFPIKIVLLSMIFILLILILILSLKKKKETPVVRGVESPSIEKDFDHKILERDNDVPTETEV